MSPADDLPSRESVRAVLDIIAPGWSALSIHALAGSYSNHSHLVKLEFDNKAAQQLVFRRYNDTYSGYENKASREFKALEHLARQGFPAPRPIYLDADGSLLGLPGIITEFVPGKQILAETEPAAWASKADTVARLLAQIHSIVYEEDIAPYLMDANTEAAWFVKSEQVPDYMQAHPDGAALWRTVADLLPHSQTTAPVFLHLDYWSGNLLWHEGEISAVVDWEEAAYGDPAIDVAYCRMEYTMEGLDAAADEFLQVYEVETGRPLANLGLWELAAAARPMFHQEIQAADQAQRFRRFIARAQARARS